MYYPQFELQTIGGGSLIAIVSIVHVFIAHFAVGAGIFNAVTETIARRRNDALLLGFLRYSSKFLILIPFVFGAVTGVGIWFSIAIVAPRATSLLIHNFVWGWATEWVFFFVEIAAGYVYYYTWNRLSPRRHLIVGWIYAVAAWLSLWSSSTASSPSCSLPAAGRLSAPSNTGTPPSGPPSSTRPTGPVSSCERSRPSPSPESSSASWSTSAAPTPESRQSASSASPPTSSSRSSSWSRPPSGISTPSPRRRASCPSAAPPP